MMNTCSVFNLIKFNHMVNIGFSQEMKMQHSLAPQLYQSLEILQMPIMDLQNLIKQNSTD